MVRKESWNPRFLKDEKVPHKIFSVTLVEVSKSFFSLGAMAEGACVPVVTIRSLNSIAINTQNLDASLVSQFQK